MTVSEILLYYLTVLLHSLCFTSMSLPLSQCFSKRRHGIVGLCGPACDLCCCMCAVWSLWSITSAWSTHKISRWRLWSPHWKYILAAIAGECFTQGIKHVPQIWNKVEKENPHACVKTTIKSLRDNVLRRMMRSNFWSWFVCVFELDWTCYLAEHTVLFYVWHTSRSDIHYIHYCRGIPRSKVFCF